MRAWMLGVVMLAGCGPSLSGFWFGELTCEVAPFDVKLELERDGGKTFVGSGTQTNVRSGVDENGTEVLYELSIAFDGTFVLDKAGGEQPVEVSLACVSESTVRTFTNGEDPETVDEGCTEGRYDGYTGAWDGADELTLTGADDCQGSLFRR